MLGLIEIAAIDNVEIRGGGAGEWIVGRSGGGGGERVHGKMVWFKCVLEQNWREQTRAATKVLTQVAQEYDSIYLDRE